MNSTNESKKKKEKKHSSFGYNFIKVTGLPVAWLAFRPKYHFVGKTQSNKIKGKAVAVSNHSGFFDPILLMLAFWRRNMRFWATQDFFDRKSTRWLFKYFFNAIPVNKENLKLETVRETITALKNDELVAIFPEGTVNTEHPDEILTFKVGAALMAFKGDAPMISIYAPRRTSPWRRQIILMDDPITLDEIMGRKATRQDLQAISAYLQEKEKRLMERYQELYDEKGKLRKTPKKKVECSEA